jgi:hypothetical protein
MRKRFVPRLCLESLEDRWTPATIKFTNGVLQISQQTGALTVTQTASNTFQVKDGPSGNPVTISGVSSLQITGTNGSDSVMVDLGTFTYSGSMLLNMGDGNDTVDLRASGGNGRGNVTILPGLGDDSVSIDSAGTGALTLGGTLQVTDTTGNDSITFANSSAPLTIQGDVSLSGIATVNLNGDQPQKYLGNFSASLGAKTSQPMFFMQDYPAVIGQGFQGALITIGKSLTVTGGSNNDVLDIGQMTIGGNLTASMGTSLPSVGFGDNFYAIADHQSGVTTVVGNTNLSGAGGSVDHLDLANGVYEGDVNITVGSGIATNNNQPNSAIALDDPFAPQHPTIINGNLTVNAQGNLNMVPSPAASNIEAAIGGNATFNLGDGDSTIAFDPGPSSNTPSGVGGKVIITAGNGNNNLSFLMNDGNTNAYTYTLNVTYGNGNNTVILDNPNTTLTGFINAGTGTNQFFQFAGILNNFTLKNFS